MWNKIFLPAIVGVMILGLFGFLQEASAISGTISDPISCSAVGGTWIVPNTCRISSDFRLFPGDTLTIDSGVILQFQGLFVINDMGTIDNFGTIDNSAELRNINHGFINNLDLHSVILNQNIITNTDSFITNRGIIDNSRIIINNGVIDNSNTIDNSGTIDNNSVINNNNFGWFNNDGTVNNFNTINNNCGGSINGIISQNQPIDRCVEPITCGTGTILDIISNQCVTQSLTDLDNDGTPDIFDQCTSDPNKISPGLGGCGNPEPELLSCELGTIQQGNECVVDPAITQQNIDLQNQVNSLTQQINNLTNQINDLLSQIGSNTSGIISSLLDDIQSLVDGDNLDEKDSKKIIKDLESSLKDIEKGNIKACKDVSKFVKDIDHLVKKGKLSQENAQSLLDEANSLLVYCPVKNED